MPPGPAVLAHVDVLVAGRYIRTQPRGAGLRGSANQEILLLSDRYSLADVEQTPPAEILIDAEGNVVISGVEPGLLDT
jgi:anaerobic ribonucleoside-triphosphate reductase activating protein